MKSQFTTPCTRVSRWAAIGLATLGLAACAVLDEPEPDPDRWTHNNCVRDDECADGRCDSELKLCVVDTIDFESRVFYFQVIPPPSYDDVAPLVAPFVITLPNQAPQRYTLARKQDVLLKTVKGTKRGDEILTGGELATRLIFFDRDNQVPGQSALITTVNVGASVQGVSEKLAPGNYDVAVEVIDPIADNEHYPDILDTDMEITGQTEILEIAVPKAETLLEGTISRGFTPENDLFVWAKGKGENSRVISTIATTRCKDGTDECGWFQIGLPEGVLEFDLKIRHKRESNYPEHTRNISLSPGQRVVDILTLPPLSPPVNTRLKVLMPDPHSPLDSNTVPAINCTVVFTSQLPDGRIQTASRTNESGELEETMGSLGLNLFAGTYSMAIYPPEKSTGVHVDYGITTLENIIVAAPSGDPSDSLELETVTLALRPRISGIVQAPGQSLLGLPISAVPSYESNQKNLERPSLSTTDYFGYYQLWLDTTSLPYLVTAAPPSDSGYPWVLWEQEITGFATKIVNIDLPTPLKFDILLEGLEGFGERYEDLEVFVFEQLYDDVNFAAPVGKGIVNADGKVSLLLNPAVLTIF